MKQQYDSSFRHIAIVKASVVLVVVVILSSFPANGAQEEDAANEARRNNHDRLHEALAIPELEDNAAVLYKQAFHHIIEDNAELIERYNRLMRAYWQEAGPTTWRSQAAQELRDQSHEIIEIVRQAAQLEYADFGINRARGLAVELPHLSHIRFAQRLLNNHARFLHATGRSGEGSAILADIIRLGYHVSSDDLLISSVSGAASAHICFDTIDEVITRIGFGPDDARQILEILDPTAIDPFGFAESACSELEGLSTTIANSDEPGLEIAEALDGFVTDDDNLALLRDLDKESIQDSLEQARPAYHLVEQAFNATDPDEARAILDMVKTDTADGRYGFLATVTLSSNWLDLALKTKWFYNQRAKQTHQMLRGIAMGADPTQYANAAILYIEAFDHLESISNQNQELLEIVRRVVSTIGSCDELPEKMLEDARAILKENHSVLELLHRAAKCTRCDWACHYYVRSPWGDPLISEGAWVRPMRAAVRFLLADAALASCISDEHEHVPDHAIAAALAAALHLSDGSHLFGAMLAAASIDEVTDFVEMLIKTDRLDSSTMTVLDNRYARLDSTDPLGWNQARKATLCRKLEKRIARIGHDDPTTAKRIMRRWSNDRLASIVFCRDSRDHNDQCVLPLPEDGDRGDLFAVSDIVELDPEGIASLCSQPRDLSELLLTIDLVKPLDTVGWQARGADALERLSDALSEAQKRASSTSSLIGSER